MNKENEIVMLSSVLNYIDMVKEFLEKRLESTDGKDLVYSILEDKKNKCEKFIEEYETSSELSNYYLILKYNENGLIKEVLESYEGALQKAVEKRTENIEDISKDNLIHNWNIQIKEVRNAIEELNEPTQNNSFSI